MDEEGHVDLLNAKPLKESTRFSFENLYFATWKEVIFMFIDNERFDLFYKSEDGVFSNWSHDGEERLTELNPDGTQRLYNIVHVSDMGCTIDDFFEFETEDHIFGVGMYTQESNALYEYNKKYNGGKRVKYI